MIVPPVQVVLALAGDATTRPAGNVSVNARLEASKLEAVLLMVKVRVLTPLTPMALGTKALAKVGAGTMLRLAEAAGTVPKPVDNTELVLA